MPCISLEGSMPKRTLAVALGLSLALFAAGAGVAVHTQTPQSDPASLPAHDTHQGLLIAADPYTSAERSKLQFGKHSPYEGGILAIDVFFKNDNDSPIRITLDTVELRIGSPGGPRQKLEGLSPEDVADRTLLKTGKNVRLPRAPIPLPGAIPKTGRDKNWNDFVAILRSDAMSSGVLPPHSTTHGFFYFDIDHHYEWLSNGLLDVPDMEFMIGNKALFFFEVDLKNAAP